MCARAPRPRWLASVGAALAALLGCAGCADDEPGAPAPLAGRGAAAGQEDASAIYNLVGRWYPEPEILRLSDRTLTPERWCAREPTMVSVVPDRVTVSCDAGAPLGARVAGVRRGLDGTIRLTMRAEEGSPLSELGFRVDGARATITGNPCFPGNAVAYARFPEYELLSREILGGRRCAQVLPQAAEP